MKPTVRILGTHGVPAAYGGFETAASRVGCYLRDQGWRVIGYCQMAGEQIWSKDVWDERKRMLVVEHRPGWRGKSSFDVKRVLHAIPGAPSRAKTSATKNIVGEFWGPIS